MTTTGTQTPTTPPPPILTVRAQRAFRREITHAQPTAELRRRLAGRAA